MTKHEHFLVNTVGNGSNNNNKTDEVYDVPVGELIIIKIDYKIIVTRIHSRKKFPLHTAQIHAHTHKQSCLHYIYFRTQIFSKSERRTSTECMCVCVSVCARVCVYHNFILLKS